MAAVEWVRELLRLHDQGAITEGEFHLEVFEMLLDDAMAEVNQGRPYSWGRAGAFGDNFEERAQFRRTVSGFSFTPIGQWPR